MNLFLAITAYDHKVYSKCSESILKNAVNLMEMGHKIMPYYSDDLYIDRARNFCVDLFMKQDCTDIVFIDADLEFDDGAISKLIAYDKDIVAGAYPYKKPELEFPVTLRWDLNNNCKEEETGLVYAKRVPTGLMRIKRCVFEKLKQDMTPDERGIFPYFKTGVVFKDDINWYGEDTYFCKKWIESGGEIFIEPRINFKHFGLQPFEGNYHNYLMGRAVNDTEWDDTDDGISGWMTTEELSTLGYLASKSDSIVEVGSWKGRSTKALLDRCKGVVYAVDHWNGTETDGSIISATLTNVYDEFIKNVGHYDNLEIIKGESVLSANQFKNLVDMVFIDAGHTYEDCKADIEAWLPNCSKILSGHDYGDNYGGVKKAVDEIFSDVNVIGSIWWVELQD